jgi:hypothetical protein
VQVSVSLVISDEQLSGAWFRRCGCRPRALLKEMEEVCIAENLGHAGPRGPSYSEQPAHTASTRSLVNEAE